MEQACVTLVVPYWMAQPWWQLLMELPVDLVFLPSNTELLSRYLPPLSGRSWRYKCSGRLGVHARCTGSSSPCAPLCVRLAYGGCPPSGHQVTGRASASCGSWSGSLLASGADRHSHYGACRCQDLAVLRLSVFSVRAFLYQGGCRFLACLPLHWVVMGAIPGRPGDCPGAHRATYFSAVNTVHDLLGFPKPCDGDNVLLSAFRRGWERLQVLLTPSSTLVLAFSTLDVWALYKRLLLVPVSSDLFIPSPVCRT
ncbi:hypothetical protein VaNZ11_015851 [Volvox africanus]|uniref:Uncharacterized protein n=1 Tax=Volvox africanus TaxID=51714 RepID=A0ABQ5SMX3_9CHLO|nr:hypothetical protein VaNZ11_015851 [Volvox africanus]